VTRASAGYSLIEVLITLVIVGMITGLLFDGIGGAARLSLRVSDEADRLERAIIASDWWRMSIVGNAPNEAGLPSGLYGNQYVMTVNTLAPLHARVGAQRVIVWRMSQEAGRWRLTYQHDDQTPWLVAETIRAAPHFTYCCDANGQWVDEWIATDPPRLVALVDFFSAPVLAHPRSRLPPLQPQDMPGNRPFP